ncbi:hypothetical protein Pcinc_034128 [Petrolisthes cinctipes]|uniref:Gustatory receptor n=1 Tax=Petrolisthes cinctipes TaxID=88211 RepID=A0AAE1K0I8_PETCI|nr:hypothetical protein Pcinc_034128 [Petrolisthes cinctipes]
MLSPHFLPFLRHLRPYHRSEAVVGGGRKGGGGGGGGGGGSRRGLGGGRKGDGGGGGGRSSGGGGGRKGDSGGGSRRGLGGGGGGRGLGGDGGGRGGGGDGRGRGLGDGGGRRGDGGGGGGRTGGGGGGRNGGDGGRKKPRQEKLQAWKDVENPRDTRKVLSDSERSLFPVVRLANVFGLLPVRRKDGVVSSRSDWLVVLTATVFYTLGAIGAVLLLRLARRLPGLLISLLECYMKEVHEDEVSLLGYSECLGLVILVINKYATFIWNFVDVLIVSVAIVLNSHITTFNANIHNGWRWWGSGEWQEARENHLSILLLVKEVNNALGPLVLQSYVTNLFFILVQLYLGLRPTQTQEVAVARVYLTWSFLHLLGRLLLVSFTCSGVHDASRQGLVHVLSLPTNRLCVEAWRLHHQMETQEVGLSGFGFFLVNKSFILAVGTKLEGY